MSGVNLQLVKILQDMQNYPLYFPCTQFLFPPCDFKPVRGRRVYDGKKLRKALEEAGYQLDPPSEDSDDGDEGSEDSDDGDEE